MPLPCSGLNTDRRKMGKRNSRYRLKKRPADIQAASSSEEAATQKPIMKRQLDNDTFDAASLKTRKGEAPSDDREVDALNRDDTRSKNQIHKKKKRRQIKYELHSSRPKTVGQRRSILEEIKMCTSVEERAKLQLKLIKMLDCIPESKDVIKIARSFRSKRAARRARAAMRAEAMHTQWLPESIHESAAGVIRFK